MNIIKKIIIIDIIINKFIIILILHEYYFIYARCLVKVGVPVHMAKILTYPERVTKVNFELMKKLIINGHDIHPGANYIEKSDTKNRQAISSVAIK